MRPYLAIDIETTGRSKTKSEVLEIAVVFDDGFTPISELPRYNWIVKMDSYSYSEPMGLLLNRRLLEAQLDPKIEKLEPREVFSRLLTYVKWVAKTPCYQWDLENVGEPLATEKVSLAGKNTASVVLPTLVNFFLRQGIPQESVDTLLDLISDRHIDLGSLYYPKFSYVPAVEQINRLTGREFERQYRAIEDAFDAVYAVRHIRNIPYER